MIRLLGQHRREALAVAQARQQAFENAAHPVIGLFLGQRLQPFDDR
jgi:hypothetical protein